MTSLVRKAALLGACGLFMASIASAAVPDPAHSDIPAFIIACGVQTAAGGVPDPGTAPGNPPTLVTITVRDFTNAPIAGSNVEINYNNCSDTKLCTVVVAGRTVDCPSRAVRLSTDTFGQASVRVLGASINTGLPVPPAIFGGAGSGCIRIYADGLQLGTSTSVTLDQNGALPGSGNNGVNGLDLSIAKNDVGAIGFGAAYKGRTDYSRDNAVNGLDLSFLKTDVGQSGLGLGSGAGCASGGTVQPYCL